jgi:hypothetical protein
MARTKPIKESYPASTSTPASESAGSPSTCSTIGVKALRKDWSDLPGVMDITAKSNSKYKKLKDLKQPSKGDATVVSDASPAPEQDNEPATITEKPEPSAATTKKMSKEKKSKDPEEPFNLKQKQFVLCLSIKCRRNKNWPMQNHYVRPWLILPPLLSLNRKKRNLSLVNIRLTLLLPPL